MFHEKWSLLSVFVFLLIGVLYFLPLKNNVEAICRINCDRYARCTQVCTEPPIRIPTDTVSVECTANCPAGTICYQPPMPVCKAGTMCLQIMPPSKCIPVATPILKPSITPSPGCDTTCSLGKVCYQPPAPTCLIGKPCALMMPTKLCVTPTPSICHPLSMSCSIACGQIHQCAKDRCGGETCCPATTPCPPIDSCPKRPLGDANCDKVINAEDFAVFLRSFNGQNLSNALYSADFNKDGKVNLVDFEIWRNTFHQQYETSL